MAEISNRDLNKMQQDAIRRVREMQRRSQEKMLHNSAENNINHKRKTEDIPQNNCKNTISQKESGSDFLQDIAKKIGIDFEVALILGLILLLMYEEADYKLIIALGYILL